MITSINNKKIRCYGNILNPKSLIDFTGNSNSTVNFTNNEFILSENTKTYAITVSGAISGDGYIITLNCNQSVANCELYINYEFFAEGRIENGRCDFTLPLKTNLNSNILIKIEGSNGYNEYTKTVKLNKLMEG